MITSPQELIAVLRQYNPWWSGMRVADLPVWRRAAFREVEYWLRTPPTHRAILLSGARQVGKTTLLLQAVEGLLALGVPPQNILYATFDHPLLKLAGLDGMLETLARVRTGCRGARVSVPGRNSVHARIANLAQAPGGFRKAASDCRHGFGHACGRARTGVRCGRWHTIKLATLSSF